MINSQYDNIASAFTVGQKENWQYRLDMRSILSFSLKNLKILDIGCGPGLDLKYFALKGAKVFGIDTCETMLKIAEKTAPEAEITLGNFIKSPYENSFFDIVYSQYSIQHEENLEDCFREVHRILKPGGMFLCLSPHPLYSFMTKGGGNYFSREQYTVFFFGNTVKVTQLSHSFSDYLCPFLLSNFHIKNFTENYTKEDFNGKKTNIYPEYIILQLIKL